MANLKKTRGLMVAISIVAVLTGCTVLPAVDAKPTPIGPNPSVTPESPDTSLLRDLCAEATEINTLIRLPDMLILGQDPLNEPISEVEWLESVDEGKDRAISLIRQDSGQFDSEVVAFARAVLSVPESPPTEPIGSVWHPELTEATVGIDEICEPLGMSVAVMLPQSFGG